ncbi:hypothetical protein Tsubulata_039723 [Turnera subulata]|uniref:RING-type domain-containing protein n=1 Tax=Turnera subulata TaxID=218843 RepID=A0A9Q0FIB2_9ROSI|nr:hypothetical protein Tsubulata_039723 [Turnera subulata]
MSDEGERTCPLCAEEMDLTDQQLKPCKCGYEICVWCWHHILDMAEKDDSEGRCPACRSPYDKEKIVGMAANCERMVAENIERKKSTKTKTKPSEGRKQLSSVRVIQRNLVYIVGLPLELADEDLLQRKEYFGQYGKVLKVSMSRTAAGVIQQFPNNTCSVYITYSKEDEAIRCIQSVHGFVLDGRSLKACFGTTKYCHAWLRNVPCTNPDCLYLHEIGSQEDSFTKDEIISAYTRSRVQQITGGTNNMLRRSGNALPPPLDDYCISNSASAAKPIGKSAINNTLSNGRSSPPNGNSGRSIALPAAASWAMRASSQSQNASSICSNGPVKSKSDSGSGTLVLPSAIDGRTQAPFLHGDTGKESTRDEVNQNTNGKGIPDLFKSARHITGTDGQVIVPEKLAVNDATTSGNSSDQSFVPPTSKYNDLGTNIPVHVLHTHQPCGPEKEGTAIPDAKIQNVCSDFSSLRVDNARSELPSIVRTVSSISDQSLVKSPSNQMSTQPYIEQFREPLTSPAIEKTVASKAMLSVEKFDWRTDPQSQSVTSTVSEVDDDIISFENQRFKDPEVVTHTSGLPHSANSLHLPHHSRSHSLQQNDAFSAMSVNADPLYVDNRVGNRMLLHPPGNSVISNGFAENLISSAAGSDRHTGHSILHPNEGEMKHRLLGDADSNAPLDVGESSIISNILSLDLDSWDDSLTSPQDLVKLLGDTDKQPSSLKMSSSWKVQNSNQSRFSFARQEESRSQAFGSDSSFGVFSQLPKNSSFSHDFGDNRNSYFDKPAPGNGFSSSFDEPEIFGSHHSAFSSNRSSVSRAPISAPPGFSVPNRAPPPGFSSHERMDQGFDNLADSSLLRNSYQAQPAHPTGNISSTADIEFMDPAILAVGKGRLQSGLTNPVLDMRSHFPQQLSALENEARLQLLMQRSLSTHPNLRYNDVGDRFSSINDSFGLSSRLVDQSPVSNLSQFSQLSLQQSRNGLMANGHMSNGHWDGWNEVQGGNNLGMAELLRNERLGFNKFYASGYEDSKYRMPTSGDLYNRTFEM